MDMYLAIKREANGVYKTYLVDADGDRIDSCNLFTVNMISGTLHLAMGINPRVTREAGLSLVGPAQLEVGAMG